MFMYKKKFSLFRTTSNFESKNGESTGNDLVNRKQRLATTNKKKTSEDIFQEKILNILDKPETTTTSIPYDYKNQDFTFAVSIVPLLSALTPQNNDLAKLKIHQLLYDLKYGANAV